MKISIEHIEYYLPPHRESRKELLEDNPDWKMDAIEEKTGVINRYVAYDESALDMAVKAAEKLLSSQESIGTIDAIIYITQSPEYVLPTTACLLQDMLGLSKDCMAFDINLGCSGFIYGLGVASSLIESSLCSKVLLICSDTYTKYISKNNRTCRPLFSDGAAASLIVASSKSSVGPFVFRTDGSGAESLIVLPQSNSKPPSENNNQELYMDGSQVFMYTMNEVPNSIYTLLDQVEMTIDDIDLFIFHQASKLVLDNLVRRMKLSEEKVFRNYQRHGNTVSATIPIAIKDAVSENRINPGCRIILAGFGVGLSLGATLLKWP